MDTKRTFTPACLTADYVQTYNCTHITDISGYTALTSMGFAIKHNIPTYEEAVKVSDEFGKA